MRILIVNKFLYPSGGSETYTLKLGQYLELIGHEVQYFGMENEKNTVGNRWNAYAPKVDFHSEQNGIKGKLQAAVATVYSKAACEKIRVVLEGFQPDVVHMNNINFQLTPAIIYEVKKCGIPLVQTVHDVQIACPCHRFYIEHKQQICEQCKCGAYWHCIQNKCVQGSLMKSTLATVESYFYHARNTYNMVDQYICPSKFMAEQITHVGVQESRVCMMYNFTDQIKQIYPKTNQIKYALYFGRFSKEKGIETLLNVCKKLPHILVVFAGNGPMDNVVRQASQELSNVEYIGFKTGEELQKLISGAAFSIYPSEWYENCPLSVIESEALGTPVVGSDLGGTKELIENGKTGLVFRGCDEAALIDAMNRLWNDDVLLAQMSENCLQMKGNTIDLYTGRLIEVYQKLSKHMRLKNVK